MAKLPCMSTEEPNADSSGLDYESKEEGQCVCQPVGRCGERFHSSNTHIRPLMQKILRTMSKSEISKINVQILPITLAILLATPIPSFLSYVQP